LINRTTGSASVVPELVYLDVEQAVDWLCAAFGCTELWRAGGHRARIAFGNGVLIVADADPDYGRAAPKRDEPHCHSVLVKVDDIDAHHDRARQHGARILGPPRDYPPMGSASTRRRIWKGTDGPSRRPSPIWLPRSGAERRRQR
jgi:uncharacterized glyoxalase superfamily protein PhnB